MYSGLYAASLCPCCTGFAIAEPDRNRKYKHESVLPSTIDQARSAITVSIYIEIEPSRNELDRIELN